MSRLQLVLLVGSIFVAISGGGCKQAEEVQDKAAATEKESPKPGEPDIGVGEPDASPLQLVTFNAGLARNYVPFVEDRLPPIVEELSKLEADVVCLQEVWEERDAKAIIDGVRGNFPYHFRLESAASISARPAGTPSCGPTDLQPLGKCVEENCATATDKTGCVMKRCGTNFLGLPSSCRTCLAANVSKALPEIVQTCTSKGVTLGYDGANGLMILSRTKFQETNHIMLDSFLMQRAVLHGKVAVLGGDLHLFCTHLSTPVEEVEYGGKFDSWKAEQLAQVNRLIEFVNEKAGAHPAVLLGDLNLGPANTEWEVEAEFPDHFQLFLDANFRSPYTKDHGHCTFCGIEALGASGAGRILDHAFFHNFPEALLMPERIMERKIALEGNVKIPLSDHYGVRVEFDLPSPQ
jgi:endonuclease/exonuclease/phosphatase family metal-dependent hydrolase